MNDVPRLPIGITSFVGRAAELGSIGDHLGRHRLVTLTGPGGAGKTRLAAHAARAQSDRFPGGTEWIDLAPLTTQDQVPGRVRDLVAQHTAGDPTAAVVQALAGRAPCLVVFDNAEHLVDPVAALAAAIVERCPEVRLLVTSREVLGIAGEVVVRVPSLGLPAGPVHAAGDLDGVESAQLFLDRARAARPNLTVDAAGAVHVGEICRRLDGLPLAIELAAARARTMPLGELAGRLQDAFRLLTGGTRTAVARQQTLAASIAWSVDLLTPAERLVLARAAVFAGSFSLDDADAVLADGIASDHLPAHGLPQVGRYEVFDLLGRLVDKSLVHFDEHTGRYRLLETIRQYGRELLSATGDAERTRDRHVARAVDWVARLAADGAGLAIGPNEPGLDDVFVALDRAYDTDPVAAQRILAGLGWVRSAIGRLDAFPRSADWLTGREHEACATDPAAWAAAVAGLSLGALTADDAPTLALLARAEVHLVPGSTTARLARVFPVTRQVVVDLTVDDATRLADEAEAAGDEFALRQFAGTAVLGHLNRGEIDAADRALRRVSAVLARHGLAFDGTTGQQSFGYVAMLDVYRGRLTDARALARFRETPHPVGRFLLAFGLAEAAWAADDAEVMAVANDWHDGEPPRIVHSLGCRIRGLAALQRSAFDEALDHFRRSAATAAWATMFEVALSVQLVPLLLHAGAVEEAVTFLDRADDDLRRTDRPLRPVAAIAFGRALVARHLGHLDAAAAFADEALDLTHRSGFALRRIDAVELVAELAHQRGVGRNAPRLLAWAAAERDRLGYRGQLVPGDAADRRARILAELAEPDAVPGDAAAAVELARRARGERGRPSFGWESLTSTERAVAAKVADGLTNNEIATALFMRPATVKSHLTRIFVKTGATNRTDLATRFPRPTD